MTEEKNILQKSVSRRTFLKTTGIGLGIAAGTLMLGTGIAGAQSQSGTVTESPLPYVELDPNEARLLAHAGYYKSGCAFATFYSIVTLLRDKVGGPYNQIPLRMLGYGRGGAASWGTLCGALNGAGAAINLVAPDADVNAILGDLIGWYTITEFPTAEANALAVAKGYKYDTNQQYLAVALPTSVSNSPLCHASVAEWIKASGFAEPTTERKERCARLSGDVAYKTVLMLNAWKAGKFVPAFKVSEETAGCLSCHQTQQVGKMSCTSCHEPH